MNEERLQKWYYTISADALLNMMNYCIYTECFQSVIAVI